MKPYILILKPQCFDYDGLNDLVNGGGYLKKFDSRDGAKKEFQSLMDSGVVTFDHKSQTAIPLYSAYICKQQAFLYPLKERIASLVTEDLYHLVERMDFAPKTLGWYTVPTNVKRDFHYGTNAPRFQRMKRDQKAYEGWYKNQW